MCHVNDLQGQSIAVCSAIPAIIIAKIQDGYSQGIHEFDAFAPVAEIARVWTENRNARASGRREPIDVSHQQQARSGLMVGVPKAVGDAVGKPYESQLNRLHADVG